MNSGRTSFEVVISHVTTGRITRKWFATHSKAYDYVLQKQRDMVREGSWSSHRFEVVVINPPPKVYKRIMVKVRKKVRKVLVRS